MRQSTIAVSIDSTIGDEVGIHLVRLYMVDKKVWEMKRGEIETIGNFNEMQLLKYALMLARMGLAILNLLVA